LFALKDLCPHRGTPLSCGHFDGQEVECCYHGWRFDLTGRCTAIPSLAPEQAVDLSKIRVKSYLCREVQGNIWVFVGDNPATAPGIPELPDIGERGPDLVETMRYPVHVDYAVVGLIDPAHGPFVHGSLLWRTRGSMHTKTKRFGPSPWGFSMLRHRASSNSRIYRLLGSAPETEIIFRLPGVRIEHIRIGRHVLINMTVVTPIDGATSEVTNLLYWTMPWLTLLKPVLRRFMSLFLSQDRGVFTKLQVGLKQSPPLMMVKDLDTQARWYFQLKNEYVRAAAENRDFVNPVRETELSWRT
jgi:phenylpropionate dioxygenase-like ring-hydroxylating dioxygenase large terminal subunit